MLDKLIYQNHLGEKIEFGSGGLYAALSDIRDYSWEYNVIGDSIGNFGRSVVERKLPYKIVADEASAIELKNRITEIAEKDIYANVSGKLIVNGFYLECFIIGNKKENYLESKQLLEGELTILALKKANWIKDAEYSFSHQGNDSEIYTDYPYDYPRTYRSTGLSAILLNAHYLPCDFKMIIYGPANNPTVIISGNTYELNINIEKDEYITIDSQNRTITRRRRDGIEENIFKYRNRAHNIFAKIPVGRSDVVWNSQFSFDVILYAGRSEPTWI